LGDGSVPALTVDQDTDEEADDEDPGAGSVEGGRGPFGNHIGGDRNEHPTILADKASGVAPATVGRSPLESENTMLFANVNLSPSTSALPGSAALQQIANGIAAWALIGALVALLLGAALWAVGSHTQNMHQSSQGRRAVLTSLAAAILIGAAPTLINFFFNTGLSVR
jgi:hypothetical protein